jgi:hypothetical protein
MQLEKAVREALQIETGSIAGLGSGRRTASFQLLEKAQLHSIRLMYCAAAMAVVLFVFMIWFVINFRHEVSVVVGLSAVFGTSITGLIVVIIRMARGITQAGLLLGLASQLSPEDTLAAMKAVIAADTASSSQSGRRKLQSMAS